MNIPFLLPRLRLSICNVAVLLHERIIKSKVNSSCDRMWKICIIYKSPFHQYLNDFYSIPAVLGWATLDLPYGKWNELLCPIGIGKSQCHFCALVFRYRRHVFGLSVHPSEVRNANFLPAHRSVDPFEQPWMFSIYTSVCPQSFRAFARKCMEGMAWYLAC